MTPSTTVPVSLPIGAYFNRPDRTSYYIGFRDLQPVGSPGRDPAAMTYIFSPKYAMTASTTYDFGTNQSVSNSLLLTRMGSDLQLNLGITYNAILSTFGVAVEIIPQPGFERAPGRGPLTLWVQDWTIAASRLARGNAVPFPPKQPGSVG